MKNKLILFLMIPLILINGCGQKKENSSNSSLQKSISLSEGNYDINFSESKLVWTGKQMSTKEHTGTINIKNGKIIINDSGSINGNIEIDMLTINTTDIQGRGKEKLD